MRGTITTVGTGVTVNSILAGPTRSEGADGFLKHMAKSRNVEPSVVEKEFFETVRPSSLLKRFASRTGGVRRQAALLCHNGASLRVDGGVVRSII